MGSKSESHPVVHIPSKAEIVVYKKAELMLRFFVKDAAAYKLIHNPSQARKILGCFLLI